MQSDMLDAIAIGTNHSGYFDLKEMVEAGRNSNDTRHLAFIYGCPFEAAPACLWQLQYVPLVIIVNQKKMNDHVMARACIWLANSVANHPSNPSVMFQEGLEVPRLRQIFDTWGIPIAPDSTRESVREYWSLLEATYGEIKRGEQDGRYSPP